MGVGVRERATALLPLPLARGEPAGLSGREGGGVASSIDMSSARPRDRFKGRSELAEVGREGASARTGSTEARNAAGGSGRRGKAIRPAGFGPTLRGICVVEVIMGAKAAEMQVAGL